MNTDCVFSTGGDVQPTEEVLTITLLAGTSSITQSYTIIDNSDIFPMELRRFIVEAIIEDPNLADFMVGTDPNNLQDRDSAVLTIRDDDGELLRTTSFPSVACAGSTNILSLVSSVASFIKTNVTGFRKGITL